MKLPIPKETDVKLVIGLENRPSMKKNSLWNLKWFTLNARLHWSKRHEVNKAWIAMIVAECQYKKVKRIDTPHIKVTCYFAINRRHDPDNYEPVKKPIMDGLVRAGVLVDDSSKDYLWHPIGIEIDPLNPRVEIAIWDGR